MLGQFSPVSILSRLTATSETGTPQEAETALDQFPNSVQRAMTIPPIHVDHVGEAVCEAIQNGDITGPVGVREMRRLLGWTEEPTGYDTYAKV